MDTVNNLDSEVQSTKILFQIADLDSQEIDIELRQSIVINATNQIKRVLHAEFSEEVLRIKLQEESANAWRKFNSPEGIKSRAMGELKEQGIAVPTEDQITLTIEIVKNVWVDEFEFRNKVERSLKQGLDNKKLKLENLAASVENLQLEVDGSIANQIKALEGKLAVSGIPMETIEIKVEQIEDLVKPGKFANAYLKLLRTICINNDIDVSFNNKRIVLSEDLNEVQKSSLTKLLSITSNLEILNLIGGITLQILELSDQGLIVKPTNSEIASIQKHLVRAINQGLRIISTACPPYKFDRTTNQFTGESGFELDYGIVTETIIDGAPNVLEVLSALGLTYAIGYADFEGSDQNARNNGFGNSEEFVTELQSRAQALSGELDINVDLITEITGVTREQFWAIRSALNSTGNFVIMRQIDQRLGAATNAADWTVMAMIASSKDLFVVDGASTEVARKFYARGQRIMSAINQLQRSDLSEHTRQRIQGQLLKAIYGDPDDLKAIGTKLEAFKPNTLDWEKIEILIHTVSSILGTDYNETGTVYLPQRYSED